MWRARSLAGPALLFTALTAVLTWPQVAHPAAIPDNTDSWFSLWRLGWIAHQLPRDPLHLFDGNIFYPASHTVAFSDAVILEGLMAAPLIWSGIPIAVAYNILIAGSFVACGLSMFVLARELTGHAAAAAVAGIVYAFSSFRVDHYYHLELLWVPWMPLALLMVHRTLAGGRWRDGLAAGLFVALQTYSSIYLGVFFATSLVVFGLVLLGGRRLTSRAMLQLATGGVLAFLLVAPYSFPYRAARDDVGARTAGETQLYAAGPKHYLSAVPENLVWGRMTGPFGREEKRLFPGAAAWILTLVALWRPRCRIPAAYGAMLAFAMALSFGPNGFVFTWLRDHASIYSGLRVPARAGQIALLSISVLAAYGARRAIAWFGTTPRRAIAAARLLPLVVAVEAIHLPLVLVPVPTARPPVYGWLVAQPSGVVAEFPMPQQELTLHDSEHEYFSTFHWRPIVNGYSGTYPPGYLRLIKDVAAFPSEPAIAALRAAGVRYVIVHARYYAPAEYARITAALDAAPALIPGGTLSDGLADARAYRVR
jgi:hypothetical protein